MSSFGFKIYLYTLPKMYDLTLTGKKQKYNFKATRINHRRAKMKKRILSILLVIALASSLVMVPAYAENDAAPAKDGTEYTTVFVHGLLGFGYNDKVSDLCATGV